MSVVVTRRAPRVRALALALACASSAGLAGQLSAPAPAQPPFRLDASLVRVDMHPIVNGRAGTDLMRDDIETSVEGATPAINTLEYVRTPTVGGPTVWTSTQAFG